MTEKTLPTLYKADSKGNTRIWSVEPVWDEVVIQHGLENGKLQEKRERVYGKNKGKKNETSATEQAAKVALAKWTYQKDRKGYGLTVEDSTVQKLPMLAYDYNKHGHRIKWPAIVQAKLDGIRCIAEKIEEGNVQLTSRTGKQFGADLSHITNALNALLEVGCVIDGEIYLHDTPLEDISGATKKTNELTPKLEYWVFDWIMPGVPAGPRLLNLEMYMEAIPPYVRKVMPYTVKDEEQMKFLHKKCVDNGFEGVMIRNTEAVYTFNHRSADLQKYKVFSDEEFYIVSINEDKDGYPVFTLACTEGTFDCVMRGEKEANKEKYLTNPEKFYGLPMTVQYFKKFAKTGLPQFPTGVAIRDYE